MILQINKASVVGLAMKEIFCFLNLNNCSNRFIRKIKEKMLALVKDGYGKTQEKSVKVDNQKRLNPAETILCIGAC